MQFTLFAIAAWIGCEAMVLAKDEGASSAGGGGAWVWGYMIVLLGVGLGLIAVCKSSGRRERAKPEVYVEAKPLPKE